MLKRVKEIDVIKKRKNGNPFISGVFVLSFSTIIVKIIGLAYKIPMLSLLGAEGMGYFNSAYEIYALLCIISTTGLPVAISMQISKSMASIEKNQEIGHILRAAMKIAWLFGTVGTAVLALFAKPIAAIVGNYNATYCIIAISPTVFFVCFSSVYRGYFQGLNNMYPTAISQIIEVLGKLIFGVMFAYFSIKNGKSVVVSAAFAAFGLALGMFISCAYLFFCKAVNPYSKKEKSTVYSKNKHFKILLKIAVPITFGSLIIGVTRIIDMTLILRRLQDTGTSILDANKLYGAYTTLALPIFSLIPSLIAPISLALIPNLTTAIERKNMLEQSEIGNNAIRLTLLLAIPASIGIALFSNQILNILFANETENIAVVSPLLALLGPSVLFSCIITTTNAILHSYKNIFLPIIAMLCGAGVKLVSEYFLIGTDFVGIFGAPISTLLCDLTIALINLINVLKCIPKINDTISSLWRVFLSSLLSVGGAKALYGIFYSTMHSIFLAFLASVLIAAVLYLVFAFVTKAVSVNDLKLLPQTDKILNFIENKKSRKKL